MALVDLTKENIKQTLESDEIIILDFWAAWCGPCRRFAPIFESVAQKNSDITFAKIDTEAEPEIAAHFEIKSIPTLGIIKKQNLIFLEPGAISEELLEQMTAKAREIKIEDLG